MQPVFLIEHNDTDALAIQPHTRAGRCPTCGQETDFVFLGVQRWPLRVVELTGCPPVALLYTCAACNTTVSEVDIE